MSQAAQTFIIYYAANSATGVCAAFTLATTRTVLWPTSVIPSASSTLVWRNSYYLPIVVFPLGSLAVAVPILLSLHAIQPTDDLHCDATHPIWGRFLGYAGISMILTIPCFFMSAVAAHRVFRVHSVQRNLFKFTFSQRHSLSAERAANTTAVASPPSSPIPVVHPKSPEDDFADDEDCDVVVASRNHMPHVDEMTDAAATLPVDDTSFPRPPVISSSSSSPSPSQIPETSRWSKLRIGGRQSSNTPMVNTTASLPISGRSRQSSPRYMGQSQSLAPAIWRLILFQMAFFIIQFLAALSTIIDVATHRAQPTPFGTQHIALVLVGWGPSIVFGHLPAVRRKLVFWRRPDSSVNG
ncbi:hypothetical protein AZE42_10218 [Rhizopogon vesiculosus]|uniref:Uncharacterized protein n=1 Tax=Rhizopogon vesiculosus TaxID=180088 RepID=A0A1J8RH26_9AGAM|nr:hypothetical protein AZE42_10218 [Rhizopogon vesiculosus]